MRPGAIIPSPIVASPIIGIYRRLTIAAPAAGADWPAQQVPFGSVWAPLLGVSSFVASAAAANRGTGLTITDGNVEVARIIGSTSVTANSNIVLSYNAFSIGGGSIALGVLALTFAPMWLPAGYTIAGKTQNIQGGDQYGVTQLLIMEADIDEAEGDLSTPVRVQGIFDLNPDELEARRAHVA